MSSDHKGEDKDVIDVEATEQRDTNANRDDISARAPLTAAVLKGVEAARALLQDQIKAGEGAFGDLEKRAKELVDSVHKSVDSVGERVREEGKEAISRVREEGKEAKDRFATLRDKLGKLPVRIDLESWVNLPVEAREELLGALGIASERKIDKLQASVDALRAELAELLLAQTEAIKTELKRSARPRRSATRKKTQPKKAPGAEA